MKIRQEPNGDVMSYSNWGKVNSSTSIFRGVRVVSCEGHGGILITQNAMRKLPALEKLRSFPSIDTYLEKGTYVFEEDCDASMVLAVLDQEALNRYFQREMNYEEFYQKVLNSLVHSNPDFYTHITGKELQIFESRSLMEDFLKHNENPMYFKRSAFSRSWDIPNGFVWLIVEHNLTKDEIGILIPKNEYEKVRTPYYMPICIDGYEQFTPNKELPYSIPNDIDDSTYYSCTYKDLKDSKIIKAYNYKTQSFKFFQMTSEYFNKNRPSQFKFEDEAHTKLADDLDLFVQLASIKF